MMTQHLILVQTHTVSNDEASLLPSVILPFELIENGYYHGERNTPGIISLGSPYTPGLDAVENSDDDNAEFVENRAVGELNEIDCSSLSLSSIPPFESFENDYFHFISMRERYTSVVISLGSPYSSRCDTV